MSNLGLRLIASKSYRWPTISLLAKPVQRWSRNIHQRRGLPYDIEEGLGEFLPPDALRTVVDYQEGLLQRLNDEVRGTAEENLSVAQTVLNTAGDRKKTLAFTYASQALNNSFFLDMLAPPPEPPQANHEDDMGEQLGAAIRKDHGSLEQLKSSISAAALGLSGSGWIWFVTDALGNTAIVPTFNTGTLLIRSQTLMNPDFLPVIAEDFSRKATAMATWKQVLQQGLPDRDEEGDEEYGLVEESEDELDPDDEIEALKKQAIDEYWKLDDGTEEVEEKPIIDEDEELEDDKEDEDDDYEDDEGNEDDGEGSEGGETNDNGPVDFENGTEPTPAPTARPSPPGVSPSSPASGISGSNPPLSPSNQHPRYLHTSAVRLLSDNYGASDSPDLFATAAASPYTASSSAQGQLPPAPTMTAQTRTTKAGAMTLGTTVYPLFCVSIHEHAWMSAGYGVWGKEEWLTKFWSVVDWEKVSENYDGFIEDSFNNNVDGHSGDRRSY